MEIQRLPKVSNTIDTLTRYQTTEVHGDLHGVVATNKTNTFWPAAPPRKGQKDNVL